MSFRCDWRPTLSKATLLGSVALVVVLSPAALVSQPPAGACTVSIFNQSAFVQADGTWSLPNVPSTMGPARARLTCVEGGVTTSGTSARFEIVDRRMSAISVVPVGAAAPTPVRIALSSPVAELTASGQTVQLTVAAGFADGTSRDATAAGEGTTYRSSNPRIATVSADGLVTALSSGRVLVSAFHETILSSVELHIIASGDSDGDGIPDDQEIALGLDPNNPADALADDDNDGLTNRQELVDYGTDFRAADTDGDGLVDGREVLEVGTSPLLFDTDGDGLSDGLELRTGSNPLDPTSFNLAAALAGFEVTPQQFVIVYNVVLGEASRVVSATGTLIDGTSIDLSARRYGTTYASSDLTIANFGDEDGRIFAGQDGFATITVANGAFSATTEVFVQTFRPRFLARISIPGYANAVDVAGDHAFVAAGATGLQVVDISELEDPRIVASLDTLGNANHVQLEGDLAYLADGSEGLLVVDVAQPRAPRVLGSVGVPGVATDLAVRAGWVFLADETGLRVIDARVPTAPVLVGSLDLPGRARGVDVKGNLVAVAAEQEGVFIVDASTPETPRVIGRVHGQPNNQSETGDVVWVGNRLYVADGLYFGGLRVVDVSDPTAPVVVGTTTNNFYVNAVAADRGLAIATVRRFGEGAAPLFGVETDQPVFRAELRTVADGNDLALRDGVFFQASDRVIVRDNGSVGSAALEIVRYALFRDSDQQAPSVKLTKPTALVALPEGGVLELAATASDDVAVEDVSFLVNGEVVGTDFDWPYEITATVPRGVSTFEVRARARDWGGNVAESRPAIVSVRLDPLPMLSFRSPLPGTAVAAGSQVLVVLSAAGTLGIETVDLLADGVLVQRWTAPPYTVQYTASGAVLLTAVARDRTGQEARSSLLLQTFADQPPRAQLLAPTNGSQAVEGARGSLMAQADDDLGIESVTFFVDGVLVGTDTTQPYELPFVLPTGVGTTTIAAQARDSGGQLTMSVPAIVTLAADPGMSIRGRVVNGQGVAVAGARVEAASEAGGVVAGASGAEGAFDLAGVSTAQGAYLVSASILSGGTPLVGRANEPVPALPGVTAELGAIVLLPTGPTTNVVGEVRDETGAIVGFADVRVHSGFESFETTTDTTGRFLLPNVPTTVAGQEILLAVSASAESGGISRRGALPVALFPSAGGITDAGVIEIAPFDPLEDPGTTVIGMVVGSFGEPLSGVDVAVATPYRILRTITDTNGAFSLAGVPALEGEISGAVTYLRADGQTVTGSSFPTVPEPSGQTDLGVIFVESEGPIS